MHADDDDPPQMLAHSSSVGPSCANNTALKGRCIFNH